MHNPIRLTEREKILFVTALRWRRRYDDCSPDVGMGPADWMLLDELIEETGISISKKDGQRILQMRRKNLDNRE